VGSVFTNARLVQAGVETLRPHWLKTETSIITSDVLYNRTDFGKSHSK
jgi:hypothetical protein